MTQFHKDRDGGKVVPLDAATTYIYNNHDHREEDGVAVVESVALEKFLLGAAREENRAEGVLSRLEASIAAYKKNIERWEGFAQDFAEDGDRLGEVRMDELIRKGTEEVSNMERILNG